MRYLFCAIAVVTMLVCAGCGGGGGSSLIHHLADTVIGTWQILGLNLPDNKLGVRSNGDVVVNSESSGTRGDTQVKIGTCTSEGVLTLKGSWRSGGVDYTIDGAGALRPDSRSITLQATITGGGTSSKSVSGEKLSDEELPPPPPYSDEEEPEQPPAPPF